jgi:hypothetical protein
MNEITATVAPVARPRSNRRKKDRTTTTPYEHATSGAKAREDIIKILRSLHCESVGFMDDFQRHEVLLAFIHRGRKLQVRASATGWAAMWLKKNPWNGYRRMSRVDYEQAALRQGQIATNSILRDCIKGQVTAVECGTLSFEAVFLPWMLTVDGRLLIERVTDDGMLPKPADEKVVALPAR